MAELPRSGDAVIELVRKSELTTDDVLSSFLQQSGPLPPTADDTATRLVQAGILTPFQAKLILQGKYRGFLLGPYRILDQIGSGGMGQVFLAEHIHMHRHVAIKVLPAKQARDKAGIARFYREARAVAALDHPNIVRAHDVACEKNVHFLVMEYIDGHSLAELQAAAEDGRLPVGDVCGYGVQAAAGLQHAHEKGLAHRDIKPANLLVDAQGVVKILDMGLAKFFEDSNDRLTTNLDPTGVMGTADYVAPEQLIDSSAADHRADIYSLGATLYHLITGRPPFDGSTTAKLIAHQLKTVPTVRSIREDVPAAVSAVIAKMMAKDPDKRYQSAAEVVQALLPHVQQGKPGLIGQLPPIAAAAVSQTTANLRDALAQMQESDARKARRKKQLLIAAGACGMLIVGLGLAVALSGKSQTLPPPLQSGKDTDAATGPIGNTSPLSAPPKSPVSVGPFTRAYKLDVNEKTSVETALFTPDDKWLVTAGTDKVITVWNAADGRLVRKLEGHAQGVRALALLRDGKRLLSASHDRTIKLWNLATGDCLRTYEGHSSGVVNVVPLPDGKRFLSSAVDGSIWLWSLTTADVLRQYDTAELPVYGLAVTRDGKRAVASTWDSRRNAPGGDPAKLPPVSAWLFEIETGRELKRLPGDASMSHVQLSRGGRFAAIGTNTGVLVWDLESGSHRTFGGVAKRVTCATFTPDDRFVLGTGYDHSVTVWDVASGAVVGSEGGLPGQGYFVSTSHDGRHLAATGASGGAMVWQLPSDVVPPQDHVLPKPVATLTGLTGPTEDFLFTADSRRVIGASNAGQFIGIWDADTGEELHRIPVPAGVNGIRGLALLPGERLATCVANDTYIRIWKLATCEQVGQITCNTVGFHSLAALPDGRLLATATDRTVRLCDPETEREEKSFDIRADVRGIVAMPGRKQFVVGCNDRTIRVWDMAADREVKKLTLASVAWRFSVSPGGPWIAVGSDNQLLLWNVETGATRWLKGADKFVDGTTFTSNGKFVLAGSADSRLYAWEVANGQLVGKVTEHTNSIREARLSPDGTRLVTGSTDGTGVVWQLPAAMREK